VNRKLVAGFSPWRLLFGAGSEHVRFMKNKTTIGQVFSHISVSPFKHSTDCSTLIFIRDWYSRPFSGLRNSKLGSNPHQKIKKGQAVSGHHHECTALSYRTWPTQRCLSLYIYSIFNDCYSEYVVTNCGTVMNTELESLWKKISWHNIK
jgi:hypothetical protein